MSRYESTKQSGDDGNCVRLTVTRKGIEVRGVYDSGWCGLGPLKVSWSELDTMRSEVSKVRPTGHSEPD